MKLLVTIVITIALAGCSSTKPKQLTVSRIDGKQATEAEFVRAFTLCRNKYKEYSKTNACLRSKGWKWKLPASSLEKFARGMGPAISSMQLPQTSTPTFDSTSIQDYATMTAEHNRQQKAQQMQFDNDQRLREIEQRQEKLERMYPKRPGMATNKYGY